MTSCLWLLLGVFSCIWRRPGLKGVGVGQSEWTKQWMKWKTGNRKWLAASLLNLIHYVYVWWVNAALTFVHPHIIAQLVSKVYPRMDGKEWVIVSVGGENRIPLHSPIVSCWNSHQLFSTCKLWSWIDRALLHDVSLLLGAIPLCVCPEMTQSIVCGLDFHLSV